MPELDEIETSLEHFYSGLYPEYDCIYVGYSFVDKGWLIVGWYVDVPHPWSQSIPLDFVPCFSSSPSPF